MNLIFLHLRLLEPRTLTVTEKAEEWFPHPADPPTQLQPDKTTNNQTSKKVTTEKENTLWK